MLDLVGNPNCWFCHAQAQAGTEIMTHHLRFKYIIEPRREKTGLRGFRPGPTQTDLYQLRKELEA